LASIVIGNRLQTCLSQWLQIVADNFPYDCQLNIVVLVAQLVAEAANVCPRWPRRYVVCFLAKSSGRLADAAHAPLDGIGYEFVARKGGEVLRGKPSNVAQEAICVVDNVLQR
jgi:hypothetical protein